MEKLPNEYQELITLGIDKTLKQHTCAIMTNML